MAKPLLAEELWERIEPLLPADRAKPKGGRPRVSNRQALTGILFVLRTGCPWEYFPQELGCGSGMTCWRRLRDWHAAGVWEKIWRVLLDELGLADEIDWSKVAIDSCSVASAFWGAKTGPNPTDRGKNGSKRHVACDGQGTPLAITHTGANVHDSQVAIPLIDAIPPINVRVAVVANVPTQPSPTAPTTPKRKFASLCGSAASRRSSPSETRNTAVGWAFIGVSSSGSSVGCSNSAAFVYVTKNETTSTPLSSPSVASSYAGTDWTGFVRIPKLFVGDRCMVRRDVRRDSAHER